MYKKELRKEIILKVKQTTSHKCFPSVFVRKIDKGNNSTQIKCPRSFLFSQDVHIPFQFRPPSHSHDRRDYGGAGLSPLICSPKDTVQSNSTKPFRRGGCPHPLAAPTKFSFACDLDCSTRMCCQPLTTICSPRPRHSFTFTCQGRYCLCPSRKGRKSGGI